LARAVLAVVDRCAHRSEPEAVFEGRLGTFLIRVRGHQSGVDGDDHLPPFREPAAPASGLRRVHTWARASARACWIAATATSSSTLPESCIA